MSIRGLSFIFMAVAAAGCGQSSCEGKRVVRVVDEPRHRVVMQDGDIYFMDVQIQPGDTTLPHTHDSAILYTIIHDADGPRHGAVTSITSYASESFTHEVTNDGPGKMHILALANYGAPQADAEASALPVQLENDWFRSARLELMPGTESTRVVTANPAVVILPDRGRVRITRHDGLVEELAAPGAWVWREGGSPFAMTNHGSTAAEILINEAKR